MPEVEHRRKKPLPVEILLWDEANFTQVAAFTGNRHNIRHGGGQLDVWNDQEQHWFAVPPGHYVVRSTLGELYPMSPQARESTTEPVTGGTSDAAAELAHYREVLKRAETAEQAARDLAKALQFHARTLYAASIDISRGDRDAAVRTIQYGRPDQWDGGPWNGFETGGAWLKRTEAEATTPATAAADPDPERM